MDHPHRKRLGQYFTPPTVVDFTLDVLAWLSEDRDARSRRVIDPACGDGAFLRRVLQGGLALASNAWGIDRDPVLGAIWDQSGLREEDGPLLRCADGLLDVGGEGWPAEDGFDWVVGNPPYAGDGLKHEGKDALEQIAARYELPALRHRRLVADPEECRRMPVEVLFRERFVQLCAPGGLVGIILPVGLFANARWLFVREWLLGRFTVEGVVGLPRSAFRHTGITAHTCLAVIRKCPPRGGHQVFLAEADQIGIDADASDLPGLLSAWQAGRELARGGLPWLGVRRDLDAPEGPQ